jgi:hypothetical protein
VPLRRRIPRADWTAIGSAHTFPAASSKATALRKRPAAANRSFEGNNPLLQIHSFSKDQGECNKTGNASISDFSTILTSYNRILADSSRLSSDEAYRQLMLSELRPNSFCPAQF